MAYTYTGTPSDKIEAAKRRISGNNAVTETALSSYMAMAEAAQNEFAGVQEEKKEEVSAFQRAAETFGDVVRNIFIGVGKAIEGVVDFGASTVGVIAGWAGNEELKQQVSDWTAKDITTGISNSWIEHLNTNYCIDVSFSQSFVYVMTERGQRIVRGVSQGIGQMLPLVLLTVATAGAGAAAAGASAGASAAGTATTATQATVAGIKAAKTIQTAGKIANMALLGMSAAGNATEEALNAEVYNEDGTKRKVSLDRAYLYGLASGAVEVATEMFVGGGFEKVFGGGVADKMISKLAKSTKFEKAVKFAMNAVGEGVEEVAAEAVSNTLKTIYNSKDGKVHWEDPDVQAMFESGVIGTLTAAVMQGGDVAVRKTSNTMTVADTVVDLDNIERKLENMSSAETLDTETQTNLQAEYNKNLETLTKRFNQASEKQQKKMLATNPSLSKFINEDGTLRHSAQLNEGVAEITREQANSPAMSQSLFNRTNEVANSLAEHNTTIAENFDGVQTENVRKLRTVLKKAGINNGTSLKVVVAENLADRNAYIRDDVFVISKDRLNSIQDMARDLAHETTHFAEGTKEYGKLVDFLQGSLLGKKGTKQYTFTDGSTFKTATLWEQAVMEVWENSTASGRENGYKITQETFDKILKGETDANTAEARLAISEIIAKASEYVLGNENIVNNLVEKDRSTAKAWLRKIKDTIKYIEAAFKGDRSIAETIKELHRAEKMFEDALAASGEKYLRGKVAGNTNANTQFSLRLGGETIGTNGRYAFDTEAERVLQDISAQNEIENFLPEGLSKEFIKAIKSHGNFAYPRLYRGMEAAEFENIKKNGYIKSNGDYNFSNQQGETFFSHNIRYAFSYATGFAPSGIRELFFEQGKPAYIMEVGNYGDLNFKYNSVKESSTKKEIDVKYITRILELRYNKDTRKVIVKDVEIDGMNSAKNDSIHGEPIFVQDRTTGQILYAVQDAEGYETGAYISENDPDIIIDYNKLKNAPQYEIDFRTKACNISGKEEDLIPYEPKKLVRERKRIQPDINRNNTVFADKSGEQNSIRTNTDSEGRPLSSKQLQFFKNSKVVDSNGNLLVVYHGTKSEFTVFDRAKGGESNGVADVGFWFIADKQGALNWANNSWWGDSEEGKAIPVYLKINNPKIYETTDNNTDTLMEKMTRLHRERAKIANKYLYDVDRVNGIKGVAEWDAFFSLVEFGRSHADYYLNKISEAKKSEVLSAFDKYKNIAKQEETIGKQISELYHTSDGYEKFKADLYKVAGQTSEDANIGGVGKALKNATETKAKFIDSLKNQGYDGVIIHTNFDANVFGENNTQYLVFDSNQIKLTTNTNPTQNEDIRYSVRFTGEKHYTREEARKIINSIVDMRLVLNENTFGDLTNKTKKQVIEALWHGLNETPKGQQIKTALEVADYIIDNAVYDDQYESGGLREDDLRVVEMLKPHLHSLNLKGIRAEIKHYFDKNNSVYLLWGAKEGGISPDQLAAELSEQGFHFNSDNEADQFIQIVEAYSEATNRLKGNAQELLSSYMTKEQRHELRQKIARDVLRAFDKNGTPTVLANKLKKYEREISNLRKMVAEGRTYNNALNRVLDLANDLKLENIKKYHNSSILDDKVFTKIISGLGKIKYRSDLRKPTTRAILGAFSTWYNIDNELLNGGLDTDTAKKRLAADNAVGYINGDILFALEYFKSDADNKKPLELVELRAAEAILEHAKFILKNYDKVTLGSRQTTLSETAQVTTSIASKFASMHKHTRIREASRTYGYNIVEPRVVFESMFGYEDNGLIQAFNDVCAGETESGRIRLELILTIDNFMKEHKKYKKRLASDKITISGHEISVGTALSLYMLAKQQASVDGLREGGWGFRDSNGYYVDCGRLTDGDIGTIERSLSKTDKEFLKTAREFFNKGGEYMKATDKKIKGYSLISTEHSDYFPIVRYSGDIAKSVEQSYMQAMSNASVQNMGITKQRVKNNKRIEVYDILSVMETHARQIGQYSGLAIPVKAFQQIYNCRLDGNISLRNVLNEKTWKGFDKYVTNWLADVQGMGKIHTKIDSAIDALRGAYAKYQLGANIKVIFSQLASYPTAFYYLSTASMTKAFGHALNLKNTDATPFKLMDKYCSWAKVRNANKGIALAEGNLERLGQVGDFFTKPIQWTDRLTIGLLWNACQCEVERLHKGDISFKYGTEANMVEAGKLLEKVGRGTQPNYTASERSALQRSNSQVAKTFSMFSSVPLKQISRLFEAFGRERALRYKKNVLKENVSVDELKAAHKATAKALTAVTVANIVYVLMGELIKTALKKDRKDKEGNEISIIEDMFRDFLSTSVGMLPIIKDVYNVLFQQYENTDFVSSGFNELFGSVRDIYDMVAMLGSGEPYEASDIAKPLRSFCYALGQVTGIPTRNIYNLIFGLTKRFDESKAYEWNSIFYSQNYTKDLKQAIESGESDKATTIIGLMLKDDGMTSTSPQVNEKLRTLYASGYAVLPRSVSDKIVYDGEIIALSQKSQKAFKGVYSEANKEVEMLIKSKAFDGLNEEVQAKAIKWIYDYYYESAVYATVGEEANSKKQLFGETMSVSRFAMVVSACSMVEAKTDKKGNVINGSRRAAILKLLNSLSLSSGEKIMILAYLGYSVDEYAAAIKRYVANIGLSKTQQKALIGYCLK